MGSISIADFQLIQQQLIDLKQKNYQLEDECSKLRTVLQRNEPQQHDDLKKLPFSNKLKALSRGFSAAEAPQDSGHIKHRLATQEDEFRLQTDTLKEEVNRLLAENQALEVKLTQVVERHESTKSGDNADDLIKRLQVEAEKLRIENEHLQKEISEMKGKYEFELQKLRAAPSNSGLSANDSTHIVERVEGSNSYDVALSKAFDEAKEKISTLEQRLHNMADSLTSAESTMVTQRTEIAQLAAVKIDAENQCKQLRSEHEKVMNKLRRVELDYESMQNEKERQFNDFRKSLNEVTAKKDSEIERLNAEMLRLKNELPQIDEERQIWATEKESLGSELTAVRKRLQEALSEMETYQMQIQETNSANDCLSMQLEETRAEVTKLSQATRDAQQVADTRKQLMDDMASRLETSRNQHKEEISSIIGAKDEEIARLKNTLQSKEEIIATQQQSQKEIELLMERLSNIETEKNWLNEQLEIANKKCKEILAESEQNLEKFRFESEEKVTELQTQMAEMEKIHSAELSEVQAEKTICMESIARLKQEAKDQEEMMKVLEKKHVAMNKDLKKQAQTEKRRADKLQEKLNELLAGERKSPGFEELVIPSQSKLVGAAADSGSNSSWTMLNGKEKDVELRSVHENESVSSFNALEHENEDLVAKISELQRSNWELQERIQLLEEGNAVLAEDLVNKSAIIEQYVKDKAVLAPIVATGSSSRDKLSNSLKKLSVLINLDTGMSDVREMNKRLQLMLEETLTKNMHLEKDVELLSREVERLKGIQPGKTLRY